MSKKDIGKPNKLTIKEARLVKALPTSGSVSEAGRKAGYSTAPNTHRALANIRRKSPEILASIGLDLETVLETCLKPGLQSMEVRLAQHEGRFTDERVLADGHVRHKYLDTYLKIQGAYKLPDDGSRRHTDAAVTINLAM